MAYCTYLSVACIATPGVYLSHETFTHASDASSCAANEIFALRSCFKDQGMEKLTVLNTKGYTGHPMGTCIPTLTRPPPICLSHAYIHPLSLPSGVSFEDVAAVQILRTGITPPIANLDEANTDPYLGKINLGKGK